MKRGRSHDVCDGGFQVGQMRAIRSSRKWSLAALALLAACAAPVAPMTRAAEAPDEKAELFRLCDLAVIELSKEITPFLAHGDKDPKTHHVPFFEDSYAVRALAVAYDMTGKKEYLEACQHWCDRVLSYQERMIPKGAFYLNYGCLNGRRPGEDKGDWWVADAGTVGMGVLATAVRTREPALKEKYLASLRAFARLVMDNYVKEDGGVTNGIWSAHNGPWWCSTATFGSLLHLLAVETGDAEYRRVAERALQWTIAHDFREAAPISFKENPAGAVFYTFEFYAAAMTLVKPGTREQETAMAQVAAAAQWWAENQQGRGAKSSLNYVGDATYMGGMPYLMYSLARQLPQQRDLAKEADRELRHLAGLLLKNGGPPLSSIYTWELTTWTMVSYAEKLSPGSLYRSSSQPIMPSSRGSGEARFVVPPEIFLKHTAEREFIGPGMFRLEQGDILMAAPWGRPPTNFEQLAAKYPVPMLYRSQDGGRTWKEQGRMNMTWTLSGMVSDGGMGFLRLKDGRLAALMHRHVKELHGGGLPAVSFSSDDGATWTPARLVGEPEGVWYVMNDRLIQLRSGRLLVPVSHMPQGTGTYEGDKNLGLCFFSDDGGQTWGRSREPAKLDDARGMAEPCVAEVDDRILMLARTGSGFLYASWSNDGGETWSKPEPTTLVSACSSLTLKTLPDDRLIVFYNHAPPINAGAFFPRTPLCYAVSGDGGKTWSPPVIVDDEGVATKDRQNIYPSACFTPEGILMVWSTHAADPQGSFSNGGPEGWKTGGGKRAILAYPKQEPQ